MANEKFEMKTRKNYDFFEVSSAFQKSIRRGVDKDAIFFGIELAGSGYGNYLWKRIFVIVSEDIGLANLELPAQVRALYENWKFLQEKNPEEATLPLIHAIMLMSRSPKSRMLDNIKIFALKTDYKPDIPDYALDVHTRRGKSMGRSYDFFLEVGRKVEDEVKIEGDEFYDDFFKNYLQDYQNKKCTIHGYDEDNVYHKSIKDMSKWKAENNQTDLFKN